MAAAGDGMDDTDYAEYNPAPYAGGYDISLTYGHPLPPSDAICYPLNPPVSSSVGNAGVASSPQPPSSRRPAPALPPAGGDQEIEEPPLEYGSTVYKEGSWLPLSWWGYYWPNSSNIPDHGGDGACGYGYGHGKELPIKAESFAEEKVEHYGTPELPMYDSYMGLDYLGASACSFLGDGISICNGDAYDEGRVRREPWEDTADYLFGTSVAVDHNYGEFEGAL